MGGRGPQMEGWLLARGDHEGPEGFVSDAEFQQSRFHTFCAGEKCSDTSETKHAQVN